MYRPDCGSCEAKLKKCVHAAYQIIAICDRALVDPKPDWRLDVLALLVAIGIDPPICAAHGVAGEALTEAHAELAGLVPADVMRRGLADVVRDYVERGTDGRPA